MANLGNLSVELLLQSASFMADMRRAATQTQQTANTIQSSMNAAKNALKGFAAVIAADALIEAGKKAFDYADTIVDLADKTGASTKVIQELRYAAQMSGSSFDDADAAVGKFAKNIGDAKNGSASMNATLHGLGVTTLDVDQALQQAIEGISRLPSKAQQNAAAMQLFGKSAGTLTYLLGQGNVAYDDMAQKAEELGTVMGDDLLRNAGQVNDQLDTMKMILDAQFASAVVSNADAIGSMATSVISLATAMMNFWGQNPEKAMAIMGALGGAAIGARLGGPLGAGIGAVVGGVGGAYLGSDIKESTYKRNNKWAAAKDLEDRAIAADLASTQATAATRARIKAVRQKATAERQRLEAGIDAGSITLGNGMISGGGLSGGGGMLDPVTGKPKGKGKTGPSAEDLAKKEADRLATYQRDLSRTMEGELAARQALSNNVTDQAGFERQMLNASKQRELDDIAQDVETGRLKADEATALRTLVEATYKSKEQLVSNRESDQLMAEVLAIKGSEIDNERDKLAFAQAEARSAKDRRDITLRLVDLEYQKEKLALEAIKDSKTATQAEKDIAEARLRILPTLRAKAGDQVRRENQGPLGSYLDAIPRTAGEINDNLERVATDGLDSLQDGLLGAIRGTQSLSSAFGDMVDDILGGLIKIGIQQAIIKPLGSLLFGGDEGGGGIFGTLFKTVFKSAVSGGRANGGMTQPGLYEVGERGRELVNIGAPANVIPNNAIRAAGNSQGVTINFGAITSNDPVAVRAAALEAVSAMMPMIRQQAADHTLARIQRPRLR